MPDNRPLNILITGATDGLGRQVAQDLAKQGHCLLLHGRNPAKGASLLAALRETGCHPDSRYYNADLSSLRDIRAMIDEIKSSHKALDVLVNNAGIGPRAPGSPRQFSAEGHELMFAVNYLAGFVLSRGLLPLLQAAGTARIINVASIGQQQIDMADVMMEHDYDDARAYRQSKLAQILDTFSLAQELSGSNITVNCLHPATLMNTKMVHDSEYFPTTMATIAQGATALERLILDPELAQTTGQYFDGLNPAQANEQAYNQAARQQLLNLSKQLAEA